MQPKNQSKKPIENRYNQRVTQKARVMNPPKSALANSEFQRGHKEVPEEIKNGIGAPSLLTSSGESGTKRIFHYCV